MTRRSPITSLMLLLLITGICSGCAQVAELAKMIGLPQIGQKVSRQNQPGDLPVQPSAAPPGAANPVAVGTPPGSNPANQSTLDLSGDWEIAFQFKDKTIKSTMHLAQQGGQIQGQGSDNQDNRPFTVEGAIDGTQVQFVKTYQNAGAGPPPVEYVGKVQMVNDKDYQGPWISGDYQVRGEQVKGLWEAELTSPAATAQASAPNDESQGEPEHGSTESQPAPPRAPNLSGEWQVGYEYQFKTIKSVMYLEQDGGRLTGHGVDRNTNERFVIERGWYNYPKITLVRKYEKGAGAASDRTMIFKAQVANVNDKDYQGPYLSGHTDGGGAWEGQLVR